MYEIDKLPNSDQKVCDNCGCIVDELDILKTTNDDPGCINCIDRCDVCGKFHFTQDMYLCPFFGRICNDCVKDNDYKKDVNDKVLKESLRCYFDATKDKRVEILIINLAWKKGYYELATELTNDKS